MQDAPYILTDWFSRWAALSPEKKAVAEYETGRVLVYGQLNRLANRCSHLARSKWNISKGDRIAILAENCIEMVVLLGMCQKLGCILVPLNYRLSPAEIDYLLRDAQPQALLYENKFLPLLDQTPWINQIDFLFSFEQLSDWFDPAFRWPEDANDISTQLTELDPVFILYTSGTTGYPKGVLYTHGMLFWNSINTAMSLIVNADSVTVNCMPMFHTGGWNVLLTPLLHHGGFTCLIKKFEPSVVLDLLAREKATLFMGVPTMLRMMANEPGFEKADLSSMLYLIVGGEQMPVPLIERWHARNIPVRQGYGMTEVGPNLTSLHQRDAIRKKGSIGKPNFYVQIRVVDETGTDVGPDETGELLLSGPMVTPGYWHPSDSNAPQLSDQWFHTGDIVRIDAEGYLFVVDRLKNMFISGGENVYPAEIERVLLTHPAIAEVAVLGVPDARWGEVGHALLALKPACLASTEELIGHCRQNLAGYKIPKYFSFVSELPRNDTGKLDRKRLKHFI